MSELAQLRLFLCGDVMTGRGVDQILPHPCPPHLYEPYVASAQEYVAFAERVNGSIPSPVAPGYVWGDALAALARARPAARIVNLETSITTSEDAVPKGINYRMHPANVAVLAAARIDCCVLANNHVLDWGTAGLLETLDTLRDAGIRTTGAGRDLDAARAPAVLDVGAGRRVLVFGMGVPDSGIPEEWAAGARRPGVHLLRDLSSDRVDDVARLVDAHRRRGDVAVASVHWGANWGYQVPRAHRRFAHALIDRAGLDLVHGHSSHHPIGMEVYRERLILYGCGDFLNDYEGITGAEGYRGDLVLAYVPTLDAASGALASLVMTPLRLRRFRLELPAPADRAWLCERLDRECRRFGQRVVLLPHGDEVALVPG